MSQKEKLIFFVDDDKMILNLLEYTFKSRKNYTVKCYFTGEECLKHLQEHPDLIVLDHYFSKQGSGLLTGLQTLEKIREVMPLVPVLILSSQDNKELIPRFLALGARRYISKDEYFIDSLMEAIDGELIQNAG